MKRDEQHNNQAQTANYLSLCISLGMLLGVSIGSATNNLGICMGICVGIGALIGGLLTLKESRKHSDSPTGDE